MHAVIISTEPSFSHRAPAPDTRRIFSESARSALALTGEDRRDLRGAVSSPVLVTDSPRTRFFPRGIFRSEYCIKKYDARILRESFSLSFRLLSHSFSLFFSFCQHYWYLIALFFLISVFYRFYLLTYY